MVSLPGVNVDAFDVVVCDLDGTLLDSQKQLTSKSVRALRSLHEAKKRLCFASGRSLATLARYVREAGVWMRPIIIAVNGNVVVCPEEILLNCSDYPDKLQAGKYLGLINYRVVVFNTIPRELVTNLVDMAKVMSVPLVGSNCHEMVFVGYAENEERFSRLIDRHLNFNLFNVKISSLGNGSSDVGSNGPPKSDTCIEETIRSLSLSHEEICRSPLSKLSFLGSEECIDELKKQVKEILDKSKFEVEVYDFFVNLEVLPLSSKGHSVFKLLTGIGVDPERVLAFGDGPNDCSMLDIFPLSICMKNGVEEARNVAACVSSFTNDEDGVAREIANIFNKES